MAQKILIIDDDKVVSEVLKDALIAAKYDVVCAHDGKEGFQKANSEDPDLILLDIQMPAMNGYEFMRALRAQKAIDGKVFTPVVMVTSNEAMEDLFRLEGVKGYLVKPVAAQDVIEKIVECIGYND